MPEGDTIFRAAQTLNRALGGRPITRFETGLAQLANVDRDEPVAGRVMQQVEARGKHLLMHLSGGHVLRTHMRMNGSWHIYRHGESWRRARHRARVILETADFVVVGFDLPEAEFIREEGLERHERLRRLGPDLLKEGFDGDEVLARMRERPALTLAELLLNQRVVAGAGNVFKSEILFAARLNPFLHVGQVSEEQLREVIAIARKFLQSNVRDGKGDGIVTYTGFRRTTRRADPAARLWVYGRMNQPCRVCGTIIEMRRQGLEARSTYYCWTCQHVASTERVASSP